MKKLEKLDHIATKQRIKYLTKKYFHHFYNIYYITFTNRLMLNQISFSSSSIFTYHHSFFIFTTSSSATVTICSSPTSHCVMYLSSHFFYNQFFFSYSLSLHLYSHSLLSRHHNSHHNNL